MIKGLVTTIIPVLNRPRLLREAVESVLAQTYRPIEVLIVDDGSADETPDVARALASQHDCVHLHQGAGGGPGLAREVGRSAARGEFLQYLDSDDLLLPEKFSLQVSALERSPTSEVAYGMTRYLRPGDDPALAQPWKRTGERIPTMFPAMLASRFWGTSTPLYRRVATDRAGAWSGLSNEEDWEYDCRIAAQGVSLCYVDSFVSEERDHGGPRLSRGGSTDPSKLRARATAHILIQRHAMAAGVLRSTPEFRHFSRELFLLSRQCGAVGLGQESRELYWLSRASAEDTRARGLDFRLYRLAALCLGWSRTGRMAARYGRLRPRWLRAQGRDSGTTS